MADSEATRDDAPEGELGRLDGPDADELSDESPNEGEADAEQEDSEDDGPEILQFGERIDDSGLSLDQLSESFADLINSGEDPYDDKQSETTTAPPLPPADDADEEEAFEVSPQAILEAMLFVGHPENRPITSREVAALMRGVRPQEIDDLVRELNVEYDRTNAAYHIASVDAGYVLRLRPECEPIRERFYGKVKSAKLTQAAVDVLAIVAYNQPVEKKDVDKIRGKSSGALLSQLVRRELLRIERTDGRPRVTTYHTTDRFLDLFGLDSLQELPSSHEM